MKTIGFLLAAFLLPQSAWAEDVTDAFTKCAVTKDDRQRLACYDAIYARLVKQHTAEKAATSSYRQIGLADLKADIGQLLGKRIETSGRVQIIGSLDMVMLKTDELDMTPVMVSADGLPRDDRKRLLNGCQMVLCKAAISGTIKRHVMGPRLFAEKMLWQ